MAMIRHSVVVVLLALICSCTDQSNTENPDVSVSILNQDASVGDVYIIEVDTPDVEVDPCDGVDIATHPSWCQCQPQCCNSQLWFCPPNFGDPTVYSKQVIVDVCGEDLTPCVYGQDDDCPPPEIIHDGECAAAHECPPTAQNLDYGWQWCEMEDGTVGKQHVSCDKGRLYHTPCQGCDPEVCDGTDNDCDGVVDEDLSVTVCENDCGSGNAVCVEGEEVCFGPQPQEEICDHLDNDCDGQVDEFQTNVCGQCGPVPSESCDGIDNDCDGETDEELFQACETACESGIEICADGQWSGCTAAQPQDEICDGLDNDCNGQIDDGIQCLCTIQDVGALFPCAEAPLLCGQGFKTCECLDAACQEIVTTDCFALCHWLADPAGSDPQCDSLVGQPIEQEECNNFDDNCNQLIDEDLFAACYSGDPETLNIGICLPGIMTCSEGTWGGLDNQGNFIAGYCVDEVVPQEELCDGLDNDCDGLVDWGEEVPDTDILFIIDWSGSMSDEINAVLIALNQFAANYANQEALRWGLIVGPKEVGFNAEHLLLVSDISPFNDFLAAFAALGDEGMDTGSEMLLDAIYFSLQNLAANAPVDVAQTMWMQQVQESNPPKDQFNLTWRANSDRVIIVFSDEIEQSYLVPTITTQHVTSACQSSPQTKIYTFSTNENWEWDEIADACNGTFFELSDDALSMYNSLSQILDEICMPPEETP